MSGGRDRFLVFVVVLLHAGFVFAAPTPVTINGRRLVVNGQTFTVQAISYSPTPTGQTLAGSGNGCAGPYQWWADRSAYVADFPLIQKLGANAIRTYNTLNTGANTAQIIQALDSARAHNLYVIMGYFVQGSLDVTNAAVRTQLQNEFVNAIQTFKDHPAVLIWVFGNEQNLQANGHNQSPWYTLVNQVAGAAKAVDPNHPVAAVEGECLSPDCTPAINFQIGSAALAADDASLPNLDIWGVNVYRGTSFQGIFETLASSTSKPILVTEFGKDAYRDATGREDQAMQASYISSQWREISARLSAADPTKPLAGGVVFEWTDEWWKDLGGLSCQTHDTQVLFTRSGDTVDPNYNDEWFGIASVSPVDAVSNPGGTARTLRASYATIQSFWSPASAAAAAGSTSLFDGTVRNYPNPFRVGAGNTKFVALMNMAAKVDVKIYDAGGQFVTSLTGSSAGPGRVELLWDGRNSQGALVSPGLYLVRVEGSGSGKEEKQFRRVVAVK